MVSIIYSIPTHLWPWLMHHWPNCSLCQARYKVQYSIHTCMLVHPRTQKITGQWVQSCKHIHSLSLSASPMDTWQQECTIINLNWSQTVTLNNFICSWLVALMMKRHLHVSFLSPSIWILSKLLILTNVPKVMNNH